MPEIFSKQSYYLTRYRSVKNILEKSIDTEKLPIIGESKIFKSTAERYGHVIIKLDLETDVTMLEQTYKGVYSYAWEIDESELLSNSKQIIPLTKEFEPLIYNEIKTFSAILSFINDNKTPLRFSVIGGSSRPHERPLHDMAVSEALIEIFQKLNAS